MPSTDGPVKPPKSKPKDKERDPNAAPLGYTPPQPGQPPPLYGYPLDQEQQQDNYNPNAGYGYGAPFGQPVPPPHQGYGYSVPADPAPYQNPGYGQGYGQAPPNPSQQQYYDYGNQNNANNYNGGGGGYGVPPGTAPQAPSSQPPAPTAQPAYFDYTAPTTFNQVLDQKGSDKWVTSLFCAPCASPCFFFSSCFCPCCCVWMQRKKLLMDDWSRYICCAGMCGNCRCCVCSGAEPCCMGVEAVLCLACAVHGNRYMVMQHYNLETDCCDMILMLFACILQIVAAILNYDFLEVLADIVFYAVIGCMLTQNEVQMQKFGYPKGHNMQ